MMFRIECLKTNIFAELHVLTIGVRCVGEIGDIGTWGVIGVGLVEVDSILSAFHFSCVRALDLPNSSLSLSSVNRSNGIVGLESVG